jgi:hypothetical protein
VYVNSHAEMESWPENCLIDGGVRVDGLASDIECALVQLNKKTAVCQGC